MKEYDDEYYKNKAKIETGHNTINVIWKCDHCGENAFDVEIPKSHLSMDEGSSGQAKEIASKQGTNVFRSLIRSLMYPLRRILPFFLQGMASDVESTVSKKGRDVSEKATMSKKDKENILHSAWNEATSGVAKINAFHGEVRCNKCVNK